MRLIPHPNVIIRRSNWYRNQFPHLYEFDQLLQESDVLCLGSSLAMFDVSFNHSNNIKAYNLATMPETIHYDFQVLKNYHSYLRSGGTVLFVLCPFTFLKDRYRVADGDDVYKDIRYYPILHRALIDNFEYEIYKKWVEKPLLLGPRAWICMLKDSPRWPFYSIDHNPLSQAEFEDACSNRLTQWQQEFGLYDLEDTDLPQDIQIALSENIRIFKEMKQFISERGYNAHIIVPPFPRELYERIPQSFIQKCLINPINEIGIPYYSYLGIETWMEKDLFVNGFLLNSKGRSLLTDDILSRIL